MAYGYKRRRWGRRKRYASGSYAAYAGLRRYLAQQRRDAEYAATLTNIERAINNQPVELKEIADKIKYRGRGAYTQGAGAYSFKKFLRGAGKVGLAAASSGMLGPQAQMAAGIIGPVVGQGAYYNNLFPQQTENSVPQFNGSGADDVGTIIISDSEFLGNLTGTTNFDLTYFTIQPTLFETFPFLSQIAANYEEYEILQLALSYVSKMSNTTASGSLGTVSMYPEYNTAATMPEDKFTLLGKTNAVSAKPTKDIVCGFECDPSKNSGSSGKYIRNGAVPVGEDRKNYDMGYLVIATDGMPTNGEMIGEVWISYTVKLRKPKLFSVLGNSILQDSYSFPGLNPTCFASAPVASTTQTVWVPLTSPFFKSPKNNINCAIYVGWYRPTNTSHIYCAFCITFPDSALKQVFEISLQGATTSLDGPTTLKVPTWSLQNCSLSNEAREGVVHLDAGYADFLISTAALATIADASDVGMLKPDGSAITNSWNTTELADIKGFRTVQRIKLDGEFGTTSRVYIHVPVGEAADTTFNIDKTVLCIKHCKNMTSQTSGKSSLTMAQAQGDWSTGTLSWPLTGADI